MIAALFVEKHGIYSGVADVEMWDEERDARKYTGEHRVIAHPPCQTWGSFARSQPPPTSAHHPRRDGRASP